MEEFKKLDGCPCNSECCNNPKTHSVEHECTEDEFCEICYHIECDTCGDIHRCDL